MGLLDSIIGGVQGAINFASASGVSQGGGKFPSNLTETYYFTIQFYNYQRADINSIGSATLIDTIKLPIPANLIDSQSVSYGEEALGTALGGVGNSAMAGNLLGAAGAAAIGGATAALGKLGQLGSAKFGITANPFLTVMFKNPNYKQYDFSWRLAPRDAGESAVLENIYKTVKYHTLPDRSGAAGGAILKYPSLVKVGINARGNSIYPFKYGVVTNYTFSFTPNGAPSFFKDGKPTAVDFKISVQEIEYFLKSSMGGSP